MEVDHIFICTKQNGYEAELLSDFGLVEGSSNRHLGQGTANRRFFFHNVMIELLWVENIEEVQSNLTSPMRLYERCYPKDSTVSPFGLGLRPSDSNSFQFNVWDYHPLYLPDHLKIQVAENTSLSEPLYFHLSFAERQDIISAKNREPMNHKVVIKELTKTKVHIKCDTELSEATNELNNMVDLSIVKGNEHLLELEFDEGLFNGVRDFRPQLPLIIRW